MQTPTIANLLRELSDQTNITVDLIRDGGVETLALQHVNDEDVVCLDSEGRLVYAALTDVEGFEVAD